MPERIDLKDLADKNPAVDVKKVARLSESIRQRRRATQEARGYNLAIPYGGRRVKVGSSGEDPRTIHLRSSRR